MAQCQRWLESAMTTHYDRLTTFRDAMMRRIGCESHSPQCIFPPKRTWGVILVLAQKPITCKFCLHILWDYHTFHCFLWFLVSKCKDILSQDVCIMGFHRRSTIPYDLILSQKFVSMHRFSSIKITLDFIVSSMATILSIELACNVYYWKCSKVWQPLILLFLYFVRTDRELKALNVEFF